MTANNYTITLSDGVTQFNIYDLEQNGPNNVSTPRTIVEVNLTGGAGTNYFAINSDLSYRFVAGFTFTVTGSGFGSPANNGTYTVAPAGSTYSNPIGSPVGTDRTYIPVVETIATDGLPFGSLYYSIPAAEEATSLLLSGRGSVNYGETLITDLVHSLENFSNITSPSNPIEGQLWFNSSVNELNVYSEVPNNPGSYQWVSQNAALNIMSEPTGFPNRTDSTISFANGTGTFTIQPSSTSYDYYIAGVKYTETTTKNFVISDVEGLHFLYFDVNQTLQEVVGTFDPTILLKDNAYVTAIYWNATDNIGIYVADERHGLIMDSATHLHLHTVLGTQYVSGLGVGNITVDGDGSSDTQIQFSISNGYIRDEDLLFSITNSNPQVLSTIAQIPIFYRLGTAGDWKEKTADTIPTTYTGTAGWVGTLPPYNFGGGSPFTWSLVEVPSGNFMLMHYLATNDINTPIIGIQGQATYVDITTARDGANSELNTLTGLPFTEFTPIASMIIECNSTFTNTPKAIIRSVTGGASYVDWRSTENFVVGAVPTQHGNLGGLLNDDHPQYFNQARGDARYAQFTDLLPFYDLQVGTGPSVGSPLVPVAYTTAFNFSTPPVGQTAVQVFVNGVKQVEGALKSYTVTPPNTVTFNADSAPILGADVEFYGFG